MSFCGRGLYSSFLLLAVFFPLALAAEAQQPSSALNEQQEKGKTLYNQNCRLCHYPELQKAKDPSSGKSIGPSLVGLFRPPRSRSEAAVKVFVQAGVPDKMPGFRYGLKPEEIDAIIAYIETL